MSGIATNGTTSSSAWAPDSWRQKPIKQDVIYPEEIVTKSKQDLPSVLTKLRSLPPLVSAVEVRAYFRFIPLELRLIKRDTTD